MKIVPGRYRHVKDCKYCSIYNVLGIATHTETREEYILLQTLDPFYGDLSHMPLGQFTEGLGVEYFCQQTNDEPALISPLLRCFELQPGLYEHVKGGRYNVLGVSKDITTGEEVAVYQPLEGKNRFIFYLRPLTMFRERVEKPGVRYSEPRFALLDPYGEPRIATAYQD